MVGVIEILITLITLVFSFALTGIITALWIKVAKRKGLVGYDMNKTTKQPELYARIESVLWDKDKSLLLNDKPKVAEAGGIAFIIALTLTLFLYVFIKTFIIKSTTHYIEILTLIVTVLLAGLLGFIDDILGWKKGIAGWQKLLLTLPIAIPLAVINAGHSTMVLPFIGSVDFGLLYPLLLVPLAIIGCTNGYNLLAGYNGLEAGLGIIIFSAFTGLFLITQQPYLALISGIIVFALLGFLLFNFYPAKVFPGDSLTYALGSLIAIFAVLGNAEKFGIILFIPFIIEGILKARSKFKAENFAKQGPYGLMPPYKQTYSLTHAALKLLNKLKKKTTELDVVFALYAFQLFFVCLAFLSLVLV